MDDQLTRLQEILAEERRLHAALRDELAREAALDGRMSSAELVEIQRRKQQWVAAIKEQEVLRMRVVDELAHAWNESDEALTLRRIAEWVDEAHAQTFRDAHQALVELMEEIRELARKTAANAQARLKAIDATLSVINDAVKMHPTYSGQGRLEKRTPTLKHTSA